MEASQQTITAAPKEAVPAPAVKAAAVTTHAFPRNNSRPGYDSRGAQGRRGPGGSGGSRSGDSRFGSRSRGGYGKRDDKDRDGMDSKLLDLSRVSHTRAGGRRLRFRAIVVSGNKAGKVGLGVASGLDVAQAVEKATIQSKKRMVVVPIIKGTISHEIIAKVGPARIMIKPQKKGRGLMAGGVVRLVCQLAGIKDISSKMLGTTKNKLNNARATIKAFEYLKSQITKAPETAAPAVGEKVAVAAEK